MSCRRTQSGLAVACCREPRAIGRREGCLAGRPRMPETRGWAWENDPIYVAGACSVACWMLRPPEEDGREAFSHAQSERELPTRSDRTSHIKP